MNIQPHAHKSDSLRSAPPSMLADVDEVCCCHAAATVHATLHVSVASARHINNEGAEGVQFGVQQRASPVVRLLCAVQHPVQQR